MRTFAPRIALKNDNNMQAFLLAAGLGTRLRPLTDSRPKALVEVGGVPLLKINILRLAAQGADRIVVNVHHFADMVEEYLATQQWPCEVVVADERAKLLDTGGGLKHASPLFRRDEAVVVHNVDILSRIDLAAMVAQHTCSMAVATLAVSRRSTSRHLLFDGGGNLVGWENRTTGETLWSATPPADGAMALAFSGIAVVSPQLLELLPPATEAYPIIPAYIDIARHHTIRHFEHRADDWLDVGKPATLQQAQTWIHS